MPDLFMTMPQAGHVAKYHGYININVRDRTAEYYFSKLGIGLCYLSSSWWIDAAEL